MILIVLLMLLVLEFLKIINEILPEEDIKLVQEILGAILRKKYLTKEFAVFQGGPGTGKNYTA